MPIIVNLQLGVESNPLASTCNLRAHVTVHPRSSLDHSRCRPGHFPQAHARSCTNNGSSRPFPSASCSAKPPSGCKRGSCPHSPLHWHSLAISCSLQVNHSLPFPVYCNVKTRRRRLRIHQASHRGGHSSLPAVVLSRTCNPPGKNPTRAISRSRRSKVKTKTTSRWLWRLLPSLSVAPTADALLHLCHSRDHTLTNLPPLLRKIIRPFRLIPSRHRHKRRIHIDASAVCLTRPCTCTSRVRPHLRSLHSAQELVSTLTLSRKAKSNVPTLTLTAFTRSRDCLPSVVDRPRGCQRRNGPPRTLSTRKSSSRFAPFHHHIARYFLQSV
ncbi:hypothetical protein BCR44DRAFT_278830 [Catenaria anguillulae PL171]|uniref:Uncharacterized protein n=1 Tax=Catenaria anguillulae PL171 TaxID=765915 RepID=A0A1Y2HQ77_9FUNG|nr:hypothetical protein BCR44DRAFT_278830 [Catenaria anguillulae PL171]